MIAGEAIAPLEAYSRARSEDESPALLNGIPAPRSLPESAHECGDALHEGARIERLRPAPRESGGLEGAQGGIGEERTAVARCPAEGLDVLGAATADYHERVGGSACRHRRPEASHLLATEDSAEVPDEGEDHGPLLPEAAEGDGPAALVEHGDGGESRGEVVIAHRRHGN